MFAVNVFGKRIDGNLRVKKAPLKKAEREHMTEKTERHRENTEKLHVILDTDTANENDDLWALSYLIKSSETVEIDAITVAPFSHPSKGVTVPDGQKLSCEEIEKVCRYLHFSTAGKVFPGSMDYTDNGYEETTAAVSSIIETVMKNEKTYILGIGAITNIAIALKKEPRIKEKAEVIWLGGHEIGFPDNEEYNFRQDVSGVRTVFESGIKLTVLPCKNVVNVLRIRLDDCREALSGASPLCDYLLGRFYNDGFYGELKERVIWDIAVVAYLRHPEWFLKKQISVPRIRPDKLYEETTGRHEMTMVTQLDRDRIYDELFSLLRDT